MKLYQAEYKHMHIAATREDDLDFVVCALELAEKLDSKYSKILGAAEHIVVGEESAGGAGGAAFVDSNTIVQLIADTTTLSYLAASLIHEATHLAHYQENPEEYRDQILAEERAYNNEIAFLETVGAYYFRDYIASRKVSFIDFLQQVESTDKASSESLLEQEVDMSRHTQLKEQYFNDYANTH
ncbi:MAG: hypothetical protein ACKKL4_02360 [Patescibacteria group bacterium]